MSGFESETLREVTTRLDSGEYRIVSTLKEGRLYIAEKAGKRFVLKTAAGAKGMEQLKREYELSIGLSHPGLAFVFTYEEDSPVGPCLVQEFVDGETLTLWLSGNPSSRERRCIYSELLAVVGYLHQKGVVHNDLKPDNILISKASGALKLIDLGFADDDTHLEKAIGGTRSYASPELLSGGSVDSRSDIYSIGLILLDLFPRGYAHIARRCLRRNADRRYQSVEAVGKAFKNNGKALKYTVLSLVLAALAASFLWMAMRLRQGKDLGNDLEMRLLQTEAVADSLSAVLKSIDEEKAAQEAAVKKAKDYVDQWYETHTRSFYSVLGKATKRDPIDSAYISFSQDLNELYSHAIALTPEQCHGTIMTYLQDCYYSKYMPLYEDYVKRINELD